MYENFKGYIGKQLGSKNNTQLLGVLPSIAAPVVTLEDDNWAMTQGKRPEISSQIEGKILDTIICQER